MAAALASLDSWYGACRSFRHRGHDILYRREGYGPALLLVHGFPTASWDFHRLWPELAARFDVVAPDVIGFGFSAKPRRYRYSLFDQADLMEGLLGALGIDSVHLFAHDYGDSVVQEMLARARERAGYPEIRSAVLMNGGMFYDCIRFAPMQRLLRSPLGALVQHLTTRRRFGRAFSRIFGPGTRPGKEELDAFWRLIAVNGGRGVLHRLSRYLDERQRFQARWTDALAQSPMPLRLIYGPEDPISGEPVARRFRAVVPNADTVRLEGIGHYPQWEAPKAVLEAFLAFHDRLERAP